MYKCYCQQLASYNVVLSFIYVYVMYVTPGTIFCLLLLALWQMIMTINVSVAQYLAAA